jgi:hypothetical protein
MISSIYLYFYQHCLESNTSFFWLLLLYIVYRYCFYKIFTKYLALYNVFIHLKILCIDITRNKILCLMPYAIVRESTAPIASTLIRVLEGALNLRKLLRKVRQDRLFKLHSRCFIKVLSNAHSSTTFYGKQCFSPKAESRIQSRTSNLWIRIRIQEPQKHTDPQHCLQDTKIVIIII